QEGRAPGGQRGGEARGVGLDGGQAGQAGGLEGALAVELVAAEAGEGRRVAPGQARAPRLQGRPGRGPAVAGDAVVHGGHGPLRRPPAPGHRAQADEVAVAQRVAEEHVHAQLGAQAQRGAAQRAGLGGRQRAGVDRHQ
ncbi:MAG: hypothetical protein ACK559_19035, partial [bacterium]